MYKIFQLSLFQVMYLQQLLACIDVLLHHCDLDCGSVTLQLLQVLITVQSLSVDPQLSEKVRKPAKVPFYLSICKDWHINAAILPFLILQTDK